MRDNIKGGALTETTLLILLALYEPRHGYGINKFIEDKTSRLMYEFAPCAPNGYEYKVIFIGEKGWQKNKDLLILIWQIITVRSMFSHYQCFR